MNTPEPNLNNDAELAAMDDPEFQHILGDLLEAIERGEPAAFDRYAKQHPRYAPALLQTALYALPASARMQEEGSSAADPAVTKGILAAMNQLGITPAKSILAVRKDLGWSIGELAKRLFIPGHLALKLERGQIITWSERLTTKLAEAMQTTRDHAEAILQITAGNFSTEAAAFSAEGDPDVAVVAKNRQETFDFDEALGKAHLTPEQAEHWKAGK